MIEAFRESDLIVFGIVLGPSCSHDLEPLHWYWSSAEGPSSNDDGASEDHHIYIPILSATTRLNLIFFSTPHCFTRQALSEDTPYIMETSRVIIQPQMFCTWFVSNLGYSWCENVKDCDGIPLALMLRTPTPLQRFSIDMEMPNPELHVQSLSTQPSMLKLTYPVV